MAKYLEGIGRRLFAYCLALVLITGCGNRDDSPASKNLPLPRPPASPATTPPGLTYPADYVDAIKPPPMGYDPKGIDAIWRFEGDAAERQTLLDYGFVVTNDAHNQICSFYVGAPLPTFITTDSILYAYFINVEDALYRLEIKQRDRLLILLRDYRRELAATDKTHGKTCPDKSWRAIVKALDNYLLVSEVLAINPEKPGDVPDLPEDVSRELISIYNASGTATSALRGFTLDYGRFRPRGLYAKEFIDDGELALHDYLIFDPEYKKPPITETTVIERKRAMEGYYRAATWLHEVMFRASSPAESRQALLLAYLDLKLGPGISRLGALNAPYEEFLGSSDDLGIDAYRRIVAGRIGSWDALRQNPTRLARALDDIAKLPSPHVTTVKDLGALKDPARYKGLRLMPRPTLFDNEIWGPLTPYGLARPLASGEELMAVMGSEAARAIVTNREGKTIPGYEGLYAEAEKAAATAEPKYNSAICRSRHALFRMLLTNPPDTTLPAYYRQPAWRYKDLNTCLAGWAHHRYVWDLHGKRAISCLGGAAGPPRVTVEPNVPFFEALADLAAATAVFFDTYGDGHNRLEEVAFTSRLLADAARRQIDAREFTPGQKDFLNNYGEKLGNLCGFFGNSWLIDEELPVTGFCVPVESDLFSGTARIIGQARPRAIYVICEAGGRRYLARGGVLSYRDAVIPAAAADALGNNEWVREAAAGKFEPPTWFAPFCPNPADSSGKIPELSGKVTVTVAYGRTTPGPVASNKKGELSEYFIEEIAEYATRVYNGYLAFFPDLEGIMVFRCTISAEGEVIMCRILSSTVKSAGLETEIENRLKEANFYYPDDSPPMEVTFKYRFIRNVQ